MSSTERLNKLVTVLNQDGFQDGYWCSWLVIEFPDFEFDWDYKREVLEPIVGSVNYFEYDEEADEEIEQDEAGAEYTRKLEDAFREKGFTVNIEPVAFVFVGQ